MRRPQVTAQLAIVPQAARLCLWLYLGSLLISLVYILSTGELNGDFQGIPLTVSKSELIFAVFSSVIPYLFCYWLYLKHSRNAGPPTVRVGNTLLGITFFVFTFWFIFLAAKYKVGVMGLGIYEAPELLTPLIQITNRISPYYLGVFFIVGYRGSKTTIALGIFLLITLGLMRASLGVFIYILFALLIRNQQQVLQGFRRHYIKIILFMTLAPYAIGELYSLRSELRSEEDLYIDTSKAEIITGRLAGRISSISNTLFVFQERNNLGSDIQYLDSFYFQRQALAPLLGVKVIPALIPEKILVNYYGGTFDNVSYMASVPGTLTFSWLISPGIFIINVLTIILISWICFYFTNKLCLPYRNEVCFMILLYPMTSGVGSEFSFIAVSMVALILLFTLLSLFRIRDWRRRK